MANKKDTGKKPKGDRELIDTGTDKRYVRRDEKGQFKESDNVGRSLSQDVKREKASGLGRVVRGDQKLGRVLNRPEQRGGPRFGTESRHLSEDEVEKQLEAQGTIRLPTAPRSADPRPAPINVPGKPLSEIIIEERR